MLIDTSTSLTFTLLYFYSIIHNLIHIRDVVHLMNYVLVQCRPILVSQSSHLSLLISLREYAFFIQSN